MVSEALALDTRGMSVEAIAQLLGAPVETITAILDYGVGWLQRLGVRPCYDRGLWLPLPEEIEDEARRIRKHNNWLLRHGTPEQQHEMAIREGRIGHIPC
jgi:hypothetical protein